MPQSIVAVSVVVRDYDEAIRYYTHSLGFDLIEDLPQGPTKRWVVVAPRGAGSCRLLLAQAKNDAERAAIGHQTGGRVFLFLHTDDFDRDHAAYQLRGVKFLEKPRSEAYGKVAVFEDLYGNKWDLIQPH